MRKRDPTDVDQPEGQPLLTIGVDDAIPWSLSNRGWTLVSPSGISLALTYTERHLLIAMASSPELALSHNHVPHPDFVAQRGTRPISAPIGRLRRKALGKKLILPIETVRGWGYTFAGGLTIEASDDVDPGIPISSDRLSSMEIAREPFLNAIRDDQLLFHYQPITNTKTGRSDLCEALLRWRHPGGHLIDAEVFAGLLGDAAVAHDLLEWTLETACQEIARRKEEGLCTRIALNLAPRQLFGHGLVSQVLAAMSRHGVAPGELELEFTEDAAFHIEDAIVQSIVNDLANHGVEVWLDDFGKGYSNLDRLGSLPVKGIKIDRVLLWQAEESDRARTIFYSTVQLAKSLSLKTIVEGIETIEQEALARDAGCDYLQGYLIARPAEQPMDEPYCPLP